MKKKIIITGGLGYIGTELCKLYSGVSWHHNIIVIDNRFISERVNQIRNWNMEFIQGDILDKNLIRTYCKDADVIHHLAGITDVPRTRSESLKSQDENPLLGGITAGKKVKLLIQPDDLEHDDKSILQLDIVDRKFRGTNFIYTLKTKKNEPISKQHTQPARQWAETNKNISQPKAMKEQN